MTKKKKIPEYMKKRVCTKTIIIRIKILKPVLKFQLCNAFTIPIVNIKATEDTTDNLFITLF